MINLQHTKEEVELMLKALQELPHKLVHELLMKIHMQAVPQVQAAEAKVADPVAASSPATTAPAATSVADIPADTQTK